MLSGIKILAIDNQPVYVQGLTSCLAKVPAGGQVQTCIGLDDLHPQMREHAPHLVFIELNLNHHRYDGFTLCTEIKQHYKDAYVAILSRYNSRHLIDKARQCGADAYIDKGCQPEELCAFISDFYSGRLQQFPVIINTRTTARVTFEPDLFERQQLLTKRQRQLMQLIIEGQETLEIMEQLQITYDNYRFHRKNLLQKMNVQNDVQLTRLILDGHITPIHAEPQPLNYLRQAV